MERSPAVRSAVILRLVAVVAVVAACRRPPRREIPAAEPEPLTGARTPAARPRVAALYPSDAYAVVDFGRGLAGSLPLGISGGNFAPGCTVAFGEEPLLVAFQSPTTLHAWIPKALLAFPGGVAVTVRNPDGTSAAPARFSIVPPRLAGACPDIREIYPGPKGESAATIGVAGANFSDRTVAVLDGEKLPTTFRGPGSLVASIPRDRARGPRRVRLALADPECRLPSATREFDLR